MKSPKVVVLVVVAATFVAIVGAVMVALAWRSRKAAAVEEAVAEPARPAPPSPPEVPAPTAAAQPPAAPLPAPPNPDKAATAPPRGEAALMAQLRDLSGSDPELSLRLAREGNRRFKDSPDEPERWWYVVRSLMNLSRPDEARGEARALIDKYPTSDWAQDVRRHLFVNPPTHPLERGYGKTLELE
jgi:hypothetical protein